MKNLLLLFLVSITVSLEAQDIHTFHPYTFVYKLTNEEAQQLISQERINEKFLHTPVDQYPIHSNYTKELPFGHYLHLSAEGNQINHRLESVNNLSIHVSNNNKDFLFTCADSHGKELQQLTPYLNKEKIEFDKSLQVYQKAKSNKEGTLTILHEHHLNIFHIAKGRNSNVFVVSSKKILRSFPINHLISPIFYIINNTKSLIKYNSVSAPGFVHRIKGLFHTKTYIGYTVTNQPLYKPNDTVFIKAFVTTRK